MVGVAGAQDGGGEVGVVGRIGVMLRLEAGAPRRGVGVSVSRVGPGVQRFGSVEAQARLCCKRL